MARPGTQSIERAVVLLRHLASKGDVGWRLVDLAAESGIDRTTAHRMLAALVRERLAEQRSADRRYVAGPLLFELGISLRPLGAFVAACNAPLVRVVKRLGGVAYAGLRSGADFVCVARVGERTKSSIEIGARSPLLGFVGGIAILVALPREESKRLAAENLARFRRFGSARIATLKAVLRRSESAGFGITQGAIVPGVGACGVPVSDKHGRPFASITAVGAVDALRDADIPRIVSVLRDEARVLECEAARLLR